MCVGCVIESKCYLGSPLGAVVISFVINREKSHQSEAHSFHCFSTKDPRSACISPNTAGLCGTLLCTTQNIVLQSYSVTYHNMSDFILPVL